MRPALRFPFCSGACLKQRRPRSRVLCENRLAIELVILFQEASTTSYFDVWRDLLTAFLPYRVCRACFPNNASFGKILKSFNHFAPLRILHSVNQNERRPEEYLLACRAQNGDKEALGILAERLRVPLFGLAYAELRNYEDAQDAVAAALLQICLHVKSLREPARMRSWSWEVARNEVRRLAEKRVGRRQVEAAWETQNDALESPYTTVAGESARILHLDIESALKQLPTFQAEAVSLHYLRGHSVHEVAERFGRPPGTVKSWLYYAPQNLAREMKDYSPNMKDTKNKMKDRSLSRTTATPTSPAPPPTKELPRALIVQTELDVALVTKITDVLRGGGFQVGDFTMEEVVRVVVGAEDTENGAGLPVSLLVLDEVIAGRPALEYLVLWNTQQENRRISICVLMNEPPSSLTAAAYYAAGAVRLIAKTPNETYAALAGLDQKQEKEAFSFIHYTERAHRVVYHAQEEARRLNHRLVTPEHLLLGLTLVPDSVGARILTEKLGLSLQAIRAATEPHVPELPKSTNAATREMELAPDSKRVIDLSYEEAKRLANNYIGVEHLLLGLVREGSCPASLVLKSMGVELGHTRDLVRAWQQNPG